MGKTQASLQSSMNGFKARVKSHAMASLVGAGVGVAFTIRHMDRMNVPGPIRTISKGPTSFLRGLINLVQSPVASPLASSAAIPTKQTETMPPPSSPPPQTKPPHQLPPPPQKAKTATRIEIANTKELPANEMQVATSESKPSQPLEQPNHPLEPKEEAPPPPMAAAAAAAAAAEASSTPAALESVDAAVTTKCPNPGESVVIGSGSLSKEVL
jgi:hypothetical protein